MILLTPDEGSFENYTPDPEYTLIRGSVILKDSRVKDGIVIPCFSLQRFVAVLVLVNSFLLSVKWEQEEENEEKEKEAEEGSTNTNMIRNGLSNASSALTICFLIEVIMKLIAFTPAGFWQSYRNRIDLFVTIMGVVWIVLNYVIPHPVI